MNNQEIIANAPKDWTHYIEKEEYPYWRLTYTHGYQVFLHNGNIINRMPTKLYSIRSREDIERIVELEKDMAQTMMYIEECTERLRNKAKELGK